MTGLMPLGVAQRAPVKDFDWTPFPAQVPFLQLRTFEALYGGAAGGGKSDSLLIDATRYIGRGYGRNYKALLLRRTFPDLEKSLIDRSRELYPRLGGVYREDKRYWRFPGGEKIFFGYMDSDEDRLQYTGAAFQFVGFDELTHFSKIQYLYLFSRCRSARGVPCRIRGATNPGGPGHDWVFERFGPWLDDKHLAPAAGGEVRYFQPLADGSERQVPRGTLILLPGDLPGQEIEALGRVFVPAKLEDNPYLLADPTYRAALAQLDPVTREQLRRGRWTKPKGKKLYFNRDWVTLIDAPPAGLTWARPWDFAATEVSKESPDPDWTRGMRIARWGKKVVFDDLRSIRAAPGGVEKLLKETAKRDGPGIFQLLPQDPGSAGKVVGVHYKGLVIEAGGAAKVISVSRKNKLARFKPFSGFASPPTEGVCFVRGAWNEVVFDELEAFEGEDESEFHDDIVDVVSDGFNHLPPSLDTTVMGVRSARR